MSRMVRRSMRSATRWPAEDYERAAGLVELAASGHAQEPAGGHVLSWLKALPEGLSRTGPCYAMGMSAHY